MPPNPQTPAIYRDLEKHLTQPRLSPYLAAMQGNHKKAVQLYCWNVSLSGAVYEALHVFEIVLRNAIDVELCAWNATQTDAATGNLHSSDWLLDPSHLLVRLVGLDDFDEAKRRARKAIRSQGRPLIHADVLAQTSFGTWRFLLPDKDPGRQLLWRDAISAAFPHLARPESQLTQAVASIHELRNRVAHLEPLLNSTNVRVQYLNVRQILAEISPQVEQWFVSNQRVTSVLKARPTV